MEPCEICGEPCYGTCRGHESEGPPIGKIINKI